MKTSNRLRLVKRTLAVITSLVLSATILCTPQSYAQNEGVHATLLIYSGRENPRIELTLAEVAQLTAIVSDLSVNTRFDKSTVLPAILGYSGFVIENQSNVAGLPKYLGVYGADIETGTEEGHKFFHDESRNIENWMVQRFLERSLIDEQALKMIRSSK